MPRTHFAEARHGSVGPLQRCGALAMAPDGAAGAAEEEWKRWHHVGSESLECGLTAIFCTGLHGAEGVAQSK